MNRIYYSLQQKKKTKQKNHSISTLFANITILWPFQSLMIRVNEINKVFYFDYEQTVQKILFNPFRKAQNTRKLIETSNKPVFKDKILIV